MSDILADDARFHAERIRGQRLEGRDEIEGFLQESGLDATGYSYAAVDDDYAIVTTSLRRRLPNGGFAESTLAMVFKADGDAIVCIDAFPSVQEARASIAA